MSENQLLLSKEDASLTEETSGTRDDKNDRATSTKDVNSELLRLQLENERRRARLLEVQLERELLSFTELSKESDYYKKMKKRHSHPSRVCQTITVNGETKLTIIGPTTITIKGSAEVLIDPGSGISDNETEGDAVEADEQKNKKLRRSARHIDNVFFLNQRVRPEIQHPKDSSPINSASSDLHGQNGERNRSASGSQESSIFDADLNMFGNNSTEPKTVQQTLEAITNVACNHAANGARTNGTDTFGEQILELLTPKQEAADDTESGRDTMETDVQSEPSSASVQIDPFQSGSSHWIDLNNLDPSDNRIFCHLCMRLVAHAPEQRIQPFLRHCKMHWPRKQYRCSACGHAANRFMEVHMRHKHADDPDAKIIDMTDQQLLLGWTETGIKCFPQHEDKFRKWYLKGRTAKKYMELI